MNDNFLQNWEVRERRYEAYREHLGLSRRTIRALDLNARWRPDNRIPQMVKKHSEHDAEYIDDLLEWYKSVPVGAKLEKLGPNPRRELLRVTGHSIDAPTKRCPTCGHKINQVAKTPK